ncbi:MAG: hypothetical protein JRI75_06340 [Deltaproteobacteria bacterium]|nr:hypothetical protein [Deltaproteobacteria bacterium]
MKKAFLNEISFEDHLGCFGDFNIEDTICKNYCVLSLRCAIERDQNTRIELLEDLISSDELSIKIQ